MAGKAMQSAAAPSCLECRRLKRKCEGAVVPEERCSASTTKKGSNKAICTYTATVACRRCSANSISCEFAPPGQRGRPRRQQQQEQEHGQGDSNGSKQDDEVDDDDDGDTYNGSTSPHSELNTRTPGSVTSSTFSSYSWTDTPLSKIQQTYLEAVHPFLPLFSAEKTSLTLTLSTAPEHLLTAISNLANHQTTPLFDIKTTASDARVQQGVALPDLQAALLTVQSLYGHGLWDESRSLLTSVCERIRLRRWHLVDAAPYSQRDGLNSEHELSLARRLFWQTWVTDVTAAILVGIVAHFEPADYSVNLEDDLPIALSPLPYQVQALSTAHACRYQWWPVQTLPGLDTHAGILQTFALTTQAFRVLGKVMNENGESLTPFQVAQYRAAKTSAFNAALFATSALVLSIAPLTNPTSFACSIDFTKSLPDEIKLQLRSWIDSLLDFLRLLIDCPFQPENGIKCGPYFGCVLLIPSAGVLLSAAGGSNDKSECRKLMCQLDILSSMLDKLASTWALPRVHSQTVRIHQDAIWRSYSS